MKTRLQYLIVSTVAGAGLLLGAACSGSSDGGGVASLEAAGSAGGEPIASARSTEEELIAYTQCMRDQGVSEIQDPRVDEDGNLRLGGVRVTHGDPDGFRERFAAAQEVCGQPPEGARPSFSHEDRTAMQDAALKFAQCMRDHGVDMPDPDFSGGAMRMTGGFNPDDPEAAAASEECRGAFTGVGGVQIRGGAR